MVLEMRTGLESYKKEWFQKRRLRTTLSSTCGTPVKEEWSLKILESIELFQLLDMPQALATAVSGS